MNRVSVKIPGKVMLAGEYSVLFGGAALAATVKNQMDVTASSYTDGFCRLESALWKGPIDFSTNDTPNGTTGALLAVALSGMKKNNLAGAAICVGGNLKPEYGFGSSSALRFGTSVALKSLASGSLAETYWEEAREAFQMQLKSQGQASGYDIVTQYMGGLTLLTPAPTLKPSITGESKQWPGRVTLFPKTAVQNLNNIVHVFIGGKGAPTHETITGTLQWLESNDLIAEVMEASEKLIHAFQVAVQNKLPDLKDLVAAVARHRSIFSSSPNFPQDLKEMLSKESGFDRTFTFKTTGAGGEDAVLLIGNEEDIKAPAASLAAVGWKQIKKPFTKNGITIDFNTGGDDSR